MIEYTNWWGMEEILKYICIPDDPGLVTVTLSLVQTRVRRWKHAYAQQTLKWTEIVCCCKHTPQTKPTKHMRIHACRPARTTTHSSFSLFAPQAVSHPSIHVTKRWVHPVTGQLVAVTLIYVAPLSSLFLLWWRDYVCSLPIRKVYSACNGGPVQELSETGVERRSPVWANWCLPAWAASLYVTAFAPWSSKPGSLRHIVEAYCLIFI